MALPLVANALVKAGRITVDQVGEFMRRLDAGYPESVAENIATGKLDMAPDARKSRRVEAGYEGPVYHGGANGIKEIDLNAGRTDQFWMTDSKPMAASYSNAIYDDDKIQELFYKSDGLGKYNANGSTWNNLTGKDYVTSKGDPIEVNDGDYGNLSYRETFTTDKLSDIPKFFGDSGVVINDVFDIGPNSTAMKNAARDYGPVQNSREHFDNFKGANVISVNDPNIVRSVDAAYDPEYVGPNILGQLSAPAAGAALTAGLLAPEEAEAGTVTAAAVSAALAGIRTGEELVQVLSRLGATPEQAIQIATGKLAPSAVGIVGGASKILPTMDSRGNLIDPRFDFRVGSRPRNSELQLDVSPTGTSIESPRIALSDLEGEKFVSTMSDRTEAGGTLNAINGVDLNIPVELQGGQNFMNNNPGLVWASAMNPVNAIMEAAGNFGKNPLMIPWRMSPSGSDFATMTGETQIAYAAANMDRATKKELDKTIADYVTSGSWDKEAGKIKGAGLSIKGWKGVDNPASIEAWRQTPDSVRKEIMDSVFDKKFRDRGGLSIGEARLAIAEPSQRYSPVDAGIQNVGRIFTDKDRIASSGHYSYPFGVPGESVGRLDDLDMSIFDLIPDARIGNKNLLVSKTVDPVNPTANQQRALQMKPYTGTITQDILRKLEDRGVNVNSMAGVGTAAGLGIFGMPENAAASSSDNYFGDSLFNNEPIRIGDPAQSDPPIRMDDASSQILPSSQEIRGLLPTNFAEQSLIPTDSQRYGTIAAPRSLALGSITNALRDVERSLDGSPASLLFPEGTVKYLETVNSSTEDPNWSTKFWALADLL